MSESKVWRVKFPVDAYIDVEAVRERDAVLLAYKLVKMEAMTKGYIDLSPYGVPIDALYPKFDHEAKRLMGTSVVSSIRPAIKQEDET